MRILIGGGTTFLYSLHAFSEKLSECGVECKVVMDRDYIADFPSKELRGLFRTRKKFEKLLYTFKPDAVLIDSMSKFGLEVIKSGIPLFLFLRGNYWLQNEWNLKTVYKNWLKGKLVKMRFKVDEQIFDGATAILALGNYIADVAKEHYPEKNIHVFKEGIEYSNWYIEKGVELKHPCVGLVQRAGWWGKSSEMLILKKILGKMPGVNFYWVGGGDVENEILSELNGFENFHWLGSLKYPDQVRQFLSEIDVYLLATGMETTPLSLKEAQLMKRPVISTNVGGTYETMVDGTTGFLVEKGNHEQLIEKLKLLLDNKKMSEQMGEAGRKFIQETFSTESMTKIFVDIIKPYLRNK